MSINCDTRPLSSFAGALKSSSAVCATSVSQVCVKIAAASILLMDFWMATKALAYAVLALLMCLVSCCWLALTDGDEKRLTACVSHNRGLAWSWLASPVEVCSVTTSNAEGKIRGPTVSSGVSSRSRGSLGAGVLGSIKYGAVTPGFWNGRQEETEWRHIRPTVAR